MKIDKKAPSREITIQGKQFSVPEPFSEGHTCTTAEASALNQVLAENVRNNNANAVKKAVEDGSFDQATAQKWLDDYIAAYEFGARRSGGRIADPVERRALELATEKVKEKIRAHPEYSLSDFPAAKIRELAESVLEKNPALREAAKQSIEIERKTASADDLDLGNVK